MSPSRLDAVPFAEESHDRSMRERSARSYSVRTRVWSADLTRWSWNSPCAHSSALPGKTTKIWAVGERVHALMADAGLAPAGLLSVPTSVNAITPLVGQILIEIEAAREHGDVVEVYLFHNHPKSGAVYEPVSKRAAAARSRLAKQARRNTLADKEFAGGHRRSRAGASGFHSGISLCSAVSGVRRIPGQRKRQPSGGHATRGEEYRAKFSEELNRTFHRVRQESIDEELFDVISGFEALTAQGAPHPKNLARRTSDGLAILEQNNTDCVFPHEDTVCNESME